MKRNVKILIAGLAIIIVTNVVALGGVAYNRSGEPDALVALTERELNIAYRYGLERENTGLRLTINCRVETRQDDYAYANSNCWGNPIWLDQQKLLELGFELETYDKNKNYRYYDRVLPRDVYLVLEFDGATYQRVLKRKEKKLSDEQALKINNPDNLEFEERVKKAEENLAAEQTYNSRLFAIDAGLDKAALRNAYAETGRYILVKASVKPSWNYDNDERRWTGRISDLLIESIYVPLEHQAVLKPIEKAISRYDRKIEGPRYQVQVAFGQRAEPWVVRVALVSN